MNCGKSHNSWYKNWFNSFYYHLLYQHRDHSEAETFIKNLFQLIDKDVSQTKVLDLACGKGRHALQVSELGYTVYGIDLSENSIIEAKKHESINLQFFQSDMRSFAFPFTFQIILNLFTSFGYFEDHTDNQLVIDNIAKHLDPDGILILDYLNSTKTVKELPEQEERREGEIDFTIKKFEEKGFVVKDIQFKHQKKNHHYREFVQLISPQEFEQLLSEAGMEIIHTFGNYQLEPFDPLLSDRFILMAKKRNDQ